MDSGKEPRDDLFLDALKKKEKYISGEYIDLHALIIHGVMKNATEVKQTKTEKSEELCIITDTE